MLTLFTFDTFIICHVIIDKWTSFLTLVNACISTLLHVHKTFSLYMGATSWTYLQTVAFWLPSTSLTCCTQGFLLRILWSNQSGHHSQNNLAKLGYILDMKVGKKKNPSICLDLYSNLFIKSDDLKKNSLRNLAIWGIFLHEKSFVEVEIILWKKHSCRHSIDFS